MTLPTNFDAEHYFDLLQMAFKNENFEEAYRYATLIIENAPDYELSRIWAYKGICAGRLSEPSKPRLQEMESYLKKALEKNTDNSLLTTWVAVASSYAVGSFTNYLLDMFSKNQDIYAISNQRRSVVLPQKSMSESIGSGLGAGIVDGMNDVSNRKEAAKKNGTMFKSTFKSIIVQGLKFAWSVDSTDKGVAQNIFWTLNGIITSTGLDKKTKELLIEESRELVEDVRKKYPDFLLADVPGDGCCFVATAVMGDYNHPYVVLLKQYRDNILKKSLLGRVFIATYYRISPIFVKMIENNNQLRLFLLKVLIVPSVRYADKILNNAKGVQVVIG